MCIRDSSYVELNYPFSVKGVDLNATCGVVPYETPQYNVNGLSLIHIYVYKRQRTHVVGLNILRRLSDSRLRN